MKQVPPSAIPQFPHCDALVLHAPGDCEYCDQHPDWQYLRNAWGINYTGHRDQTKAVCPAERQRPVDVIENWGGNVPVVNGQWAPRVDPEELKEAADRLLDLVKQLTQAPS